MVRDDARDNTSRDGHQNEIAIVTAHIVIAARWCAQVLTTPVGHGVRATTVLGRHVATLLVPAFAMAAVGHAAMVLILMILVLVILPQGLSYHDR